MSELFSRWIFVAIVLLPVAYFMDKIQRRCGGYRYIYKGSKWQWDKWQWKKDIYIPWYVVWLILVALATIVIIVAINLPHPPPYEPRLSNYQEEMSE
jgi:ABC-type Fe3+ transport system permease subunit